MPDGCCTTFSWYLYLNQVPLAKKIECLIIKQFLALATIAIEDFFMRRSPHFSKGGSQIHRTKRRRLQFKNMRRVQHKRRLIFFLQENRG